MSLIEETKEELEEIKALRSISNALLEISILRIKSVRMEFEKNKEFFKEISDLYNLVKYSALKQNFVAKGFKTTKNTISVAVTSNNRFYGALNSNTVESFINGIKQSKTDLLIIGHTGRRYMEETGYRKQSTYMVFNKDYPTPTETKVFLEKVRPYKKVVIYYPKFVNIFTQDIDVTDITHTVQQKEVADRKIEHIFEPELEHILYFFETQVRQLLFMRVMLESELSRIAARLVKMNSTEDKATAAIEQKEYILRKATMSLNDTRLLETFAVSKKWKN